MGAAALVAAVLTTALSANGATGCRVAYAVTNQCQGGFDAEVSVNKPGDPMTG